MYTIRDVFGIPGIASVNVINHAMLVSILDYENFKCRKRLVDKLVKECNENIEEAKLTKVACKFQHVNECVCFYTVFIVLAVIAIRICIGIGAYFTYKT